MLFKDHKQFAGTVCLRLWHLLQISSVSLQLSPWQGIMHRQDTDQEEENKPGKSNRSTGLPRDRVGVPAAGPAWRRVVSHIDDGGSSYRLRRRGAHRVTGATGTIGATGDIGMTGCGCIGATGAVYILLN